jgi:uncharacterized protein (DUF433 family)
MTTTHQLASDLAIRPLAEDDPRLRVALFTIREASMYLGVPLSTLHYWLRRVGYADGDPLIQSYAPEPGVPSIPFVGLAEGYVLAAFRSAGVSLKRIRPALDELKRDIGIPYALASGHLYTDGLEVLFDYAARAGNDVLRTLTELRSGQTVIRPIVQDALKKIQWDEDRWPRQLRLPAFTVAEVVVDVSRAYGRPLLPHGGARVDDLVGRWLGKDSIRDIARDFGVPEDECEDAIRVAVQSRAA